MEKQIYLDLENKKDCNKIKFSIFYSDKEYWLTVGCVNVDGHIESCNIFEDSFRLKVLSVARKSKARLKESFVILKDNYGQIKSNIDRKFGDITFDETKLLSWLAENAA